MKTYSIKIDAMIKVKAVNKAKAYEKIGMVVESHQAVDFESISLVMLSDIEEE